MSSSVGRNPVSKGDLVECLGKEVSLPVACLWVGVLVAGAEQGKASQPRWQRVQRGEANLED